MSESTASGPRHVVHVLLGPHERRGITRLDRLPVEQFVGHERGNLVAGIGGDRDPHHGSLILDDGDATGHMWTVTRGSQTATIGPDRDRAARPGKNVMTTDEA